MLDIEFLMSVFARLIVGLPMTLQLAFVSVSLGFVLALSFAILQEIVRYKFFCWPISALVGCIRGTPLLVQIFIIYYGFSQFREVIDFLGLWWFFREPYWCAILALTLNTAAYGSEIIRGSIQSVPPGQIEAAKAMGMSSSLMYRRIILPLAMRHAIPAYGNEIILIVKATSLTSIITMVEVTKIAHEIMSQTYRATEVFICAGLIYLTINFIITSSMSKLEYSLSAHLRPASNSKAKPDKSQDLPPENLCHI